MSSLILPLIVLFLLEGTTGICPNISWTGGEALKWPSSTTERVYKTSKLFDSKNLLATRLAIHNDQAFLAIPRLKPGIPLTLGKMSLKSKHCEAKLEPFPSWSLQEEGNCRSFQNVVDVFADGKGIIWALDTGVVNSLDKPLRRCPAKVLALNSRSGKLVKTINLSDYTTKSSRLQYLAVESKSNRAFVYVSDASSRAIIVYDAASGRGYRMLLPRQVSQGCPTRDVLYLGLLQSSSRESSCLVFTYLSGKRSFALRTRQLEDGFADGGEINDLGPKDGKVVLLGADGRSGRLFYRYEGHSDVYSYALKNCSRSEDGEVRKLYNGRRHELPTHVLNDGKRRRTRVLESGFYDYFQGTLGCGVYHVINTF